MKKHIFSKNTDNPKERHVVLIAPDIPWNTGNIGRTCLGTGARLHLVKPLGFSLKGHDLKRAGLDYWHRVKLTVWDDFDSFEKKMVPQNKEVAIFSKNGAKAFWEMPSPERLFLIFGSETRGISETILSRYHHATYQIPIMDEIRSLNLSTAVGIALYQSLRP
jgi:tRNA (cytidine/uridine-2'-O-)-methyltransferase